VDTHENIKFLREKLGLSQEALAERVGYSDRSSIAKIESGKVDLAQSKISAFAAALHVTPAQLMGLDDSSHIANILPLPESRSYPLLGNIACGEPILAEENIREYIQFPDALNADFCLRCRGDSMINARILDGDIVLIRKQRSVENGEIAAVRIGDEATLKRVYYTPGSDRITLRPCNPLYPDMEYEGERLSEIEIIGKAVSFISAID